MIKRTVLHIVETLATGVRSFLLDLTSRQVEEYEVYILFGLRIGTIESAESGFDSRIKFIYTSDFKGVVGSVINPKAYLTIRKTYNEIKPDIVHLHSSAAGFIGRFALPCKKAKVVYTPHCFAFLKKDVSKLVSGVFHSIERIAAKRHCMLVACGKGEYEYAKQMTSRCALVNNGVDYSHLGIMNSENPSREVVITARITYQKNPYLFNEIAKAMPDVKFIWIGDGELRDVLTASNIEVTGWVSRDSIFEMMKKASVFLFPSLWEGLSISLLEAMYYKKVCVVSNSIGNADVIINGENGFVCDSVDEYVSRINDVLNGGDRIDNIRENAKKSVVDVYNTDSMWNGYNSIYKHLIAE